jgi:NAD(P)-dependent dehydrogenase (short-subunit alcohol dehydrogenase family)
VTGTALVTGAASGIGRALVELLEAEGHEVTALDLRDGFDVGDPGAWESVGPIDLAFLNAGVSTGISDLTEVSDDAYRRIRGANLDGVVYGTRRLAAVMRPGSAIVATASLAGLTAMEGDSLYTATKHAVVGFVRAVAPQLAERGIRISAIAPGFADTPILDGELRTGLEAAGFPLLTAEEVAAAALAAAQGEPGAVWVVQPGREPLAFRFPNVPGPRTPEGERLSG